MNLFSRERRKNDDAFGKRPLVIIERERERKEISY
jgi:hypothetical protein